MPLLTMHTERGPVSLRPDEGQPAGWYVVYSQKDNAQVYHTTSFCCDCPAFQFGRGKICKHMAAARLADAERGAAPETVHVDAGYRAHVDTCMAAALRRPPQVVQHRADFLKQVPIPRKHSPALVAWVEALRVATEKDGLAEAEAAHVGVKEQLFGELPQSGEQVAG